MLFVDALSNDSCFPPSSAKSEGATVERHLELAPHLDVARHAAACAHVTGQAATGGSRRIVQNVDVPRRARRTARKRVRRPLREVRLWYVLYLAFYGEHMHTYIHDTLNISAV